MEKLPNIEMKSDPLEVFFFFFSLKELFLGLQRQLFSSLKAAIVVLMLSAPGQTFPVFPVICLKTWFF